VVGLSFAGRDLHWFRNARQELPEENMPDLEQRLRTLEGRVRALEDELAIHRTVVLYGLAADAGDAERAAATFAEGAVYDTDVLVMDGREQVARMLRGDRHRGMVGRCAHQIGPAVVRVDGDAAVALGYSRVYLRSDDAIGIYRISVNRWELEKREDHWRILRRTTRLLGHEEAAALLRAGLDSLAE
jgi:ketosteroid isomerase-like protein